jgi:hypothetical protein
MTDINLFPHIDVLSDELCLVAIDPATGVTGHFTVAELKTYFGATGASTGVGYKFTKELIYIEPDDTKGLAYFLGTQKNTATWQNPHDLGALICSMSSAYIPSYNVPRAIVNRQPIQDIGTANIPGSYYDIDLINKGLIPKGIYMKGRNYPANNPCNWQLLARETNSDFEVVLTVTNDPLGQNQGKYYPIAGASKKYSYYRIFQNGASSTGDNIFCVGGVELYGSLGYN